MTGLDKIIESIAAAAQEQAQAILDEARAEAKNIIDQSDAEAGEECATIVENTRAEAERLSRMFRSGAELNGRKALLKTRRGMIDEVIEQAVQQLKKLPAEEYFTVLAKLAAKHAEAGEGEIVLSSADKARVPAGFIEKVNSSLAAGRLSLAEDTVETDGGFVLRYGGIEENCTFDAIAEQEREHLSDELDTLLFS